MARYTIAYEFYDDEGNHHWNTAVHFAGDKKIAEQNLIEFYRSHGTEVCVIWSIEE